MLVLWLGFMGWLIRYEVYPERFTSRLDGYRGLWSEDTLLADSWMRIEQQGVPLGYSHAHMDLNEDDPVQHHRLTVNMHLNFSGLGLEQDLVVEVSAGLDMMQELQRFAFRLNMQEQRLHMTGQRREGDQFAVTLRAGTGLQEMMVEIPSDAIVYSPMTDLAVRNMRPGQTLTLRTWNPLTQSTESIELRGLREETVELDGRRYDTVVVEAGMAALGAATRSWVHAEEGVIRQEAPLGWTLEKCTPEEAFDTLREARALAGQADGARGGWPALPGLSLF